MPVTIDGTTGTTGISLIQASAIPNGAVTQSDLASGVAGTGPAFHAWASTGTNTGTGTVTRVIFASTEFDTANCWFGTNGNSKFVPNVAGYYKIGGQVASPEYYPYQTVKVYKNGSLYKYGFGGLPSNSPNLLQFDVLVYLNGSTDYIEIYWDQYSGSTVNTVVGQPYTYIHGFLARGA